MFDHDYEEWAQMEEDRKAGQALREEADRAEKFVATEAGKAYITRKSGEKFESPDGMVRDTSANKPQFTLMFPKDVPYEDQLMTRVADLYHRGGVSYGARNWEKSSTEESLAKHEDCLMRHVIKFLLGVEDGEDHAAAVVWNVNAVDLTRRKIREKKQAHLDAFGGCGKNLPDTVNLNTSGVKEVLPEYEAEDKPFPTVEFSHGDVLLDKNYLRWEYESKSRRWYCTTAPNIFDGVAELAYVYGPLMFQNGAYAGITMLKDGSLRWG